MKTTFKKIAAAVMAAATLAVGMTSMSVNAANIEDKIYSFYVTCSRYGGAGYTGVEEKTNTSSVYMKLSTPRTVKVETQGSKYTNKNFNNYTCNGDYAVVKTGEWFIYNNIGERLGSGAYARLAIWANTTAGNASGVWSPDSVGNYPVVNK